MRSRITLVALDRRHASIAEASFHVDKALTSCLKPGDQVHLSRTNCGGLALSAIRAGDLVVAVGAVTSVPLGSRVRAEVPIDLLEGAEAIFRQYDPEFEFPELPLDLTIDTSRSILYGGRRRVGDYHVFVVHGFLRGIPGANECVAIYRDRMCPDVAPQASAMLMDVSDALSMSR